MYFVIRKSKDGQFYWLLKGENQETVAVSETYTRKRSAEETIEAIKEDAGAALVLDLTEDVSPGVRRLP